MRLHVHVHVRNQQYIPSKREIEILIEYSAVLPFGYCSSILFTFLFVELVHLLNTQIRMDSRTLDVGYLSANSKICTEE